jgi:antitoxin PrlF
VHSFKTDEITLSDVAEKDDPILEKFLDFLTQDMANHPEKLRPIDNALFERMQILVAQTEVDLDTKLLSEDK